MTETSIQDKYDGCPKCSFDKFGIRWVSERSAGWFREPRPEHMRVTCTACYYVTLVKPGGITAQRTTT